MSNKFLTLSSSSQRDGVLRRSLIIGAGALAVFPVTARATPFEPIAPASRIGKVRIGGRSIAYEAVASEMVMSNAAGQARATIFSVAYLAKGASARRRPVTFVFNGGPGAATWILRQHLAPRVFAKAATPRGFDFVDNPDSPFDHTDLVFIDAPGTGYSRMVDEAAKTEFYGVEADGRAFASFIARWLAQNGRLASPLFILGESYGGVRSAQIVRNLAARPEGAVRPRGVVLVSPALSGARNAEGAMAPSLAAFPSQAAVAWYHKRGDFVGQPLETVATRAEAFARGPLASGLGQGASLDAAAKVDLAAQSAAFLGVSAEAILQANLTLPSATFRDLLLAGKGERVGGDDGRKHAPRPASGRDSLIDVTEGYDLHAAIVAIVAEDVGYQAVGPYRRDPSEHSRLWDRTIGAQPSTLPDVLRAAAAADPKLRVMLNVGYFDLTVPYLLAKVGLAEQGGLHGDQLTVGYFATGHAVFGDEALRPRTVAELRTFYQRTLAL